MSVFNVEVKKLITNLTSPAATTVTKHRKKTNNDKVAFSIFRNFNLKREKKVFFYTVCYRSKNVSITNCGDLIMWFKKNWSVISDIKSP